MLCVFRSPALFVGASRFVYSKLLCPFIGDQVFLFFLTFHCLYVASFAFCSWLLLVICVFQTVEKVYAHEHAKARNIYFSVNIARVHEHQGYWENIIIKLKQKVKHKEAEELNEIKIHTPSKVYSMRECDIGLYILHGVCHCWCQLIFWLPEPRRKREWIIMYLTFVEYCLCERM